MFLFCFGQLWCETWNLSSAYHEMRTYQCWTVANRCSLSKTGSCGLLVIVALDGRPTLPELALWGHDIANTWHYASWIALTEPHVCMYVCVILVCCEVLLLIGFGIQVWIGGWIILSDNHILHGELEHGLCVGRCCRACDILRYQWRKSVRVLIYHLSEYSWDVWNTRPIYFRGVAALLLSPLLVCMVLACVCVRFFQWIDLTWGQFSVLCWEIGTAILNELFSTCLY